MVPPGQEFPVGEYAMLFPDMDPGGYERLVSSIRDHGLLESIAVWRGEVVDGRHRLRACLEAVVEPRFVP